MSSTTWSDSPPAASMPEKVMFVPECYVDTALTQVLLADRLTFINHQKTISKVARVFQDQAALNNGPRFIVGLVDNDKKLGQVKYLSQFTRLFQERSGPDCRYSIYQHPAAASHFVIILNPACDTWIFEAAQAAGLDVASFGLPTALTGFLEITKKSTAVKNPSLRRLLQAIRQAQPPAYRELAGFVAEVMDENSRLWRLP